MALKITSIGLSLLTAFASSLCCIAPILAIVAGTSSLATNFAWIEPLRPYFMGATIGILGLAWYQNLKPKPVVADCCATQNGAKKSFFQIKLSTFFTRCNRKIGTFAVTPHGKSGLYACYYRDFAATPQHKIPKHYSLNFQFAKRLNLL